MGAGPGRGIGAEDLGALPFILEDLGLITPNVYALCDCVHLPGRCVLQFTFDSHSENPYKAGIDVDALAAQLKDEGAKSFVKSWHELMEVIASKSATLGKAS